MLMRSLSRHLQPAPYPYGLLTLRLLGKLGGKNREFLRDHTFLPLITGEQGNAHSDYYNHHYHHLNNDFLLPWMMVPDCSWPVSDNKGNKKDTTDTMSQTDVQTFDLPVPLHQSVEMLEKLILCEPISTGESSPALEKKVDSGSSGSNTKREIAWDDRGGQQLWECRDLEEVDFDAYSKNVMLETKNSQARAAFTVVTSAMKCCLRLQQKRMGTEADSGRHAHQQERLLRHSAHAEEASVVAGFLYYATLEEENNNKEKMALDLLKKFLPSLEPTFAAEAITSVLKQIPDSKAQPVLAVVKDLLEQEFQSRLTTNVPGTHDPSAAADATQSFDFCSCLVRSLCGACNSNHWGKQHVVRCLLVFILKQKQADSPKQVDCDCRSLEIDLLIAAFVSIKTTPREIALASARAAEFFLQVCTCVYDTDGRCWKNRPSDLDNSDDETTVFSTIVWDPLITAKQMSKLKNQRRKVDKSYRAEDGTTSGSQTREKGQEGSEPSVDPNSKTSQSNGPVDEAVRIALQELVSPQHLVR